MGPLAPTSYIFLPAKRFWCLLPLQRYAGGWEEVRFLPRQEQALQVRDGEAGGDPRLGGRSRSDECWSAGKDDHLPRLCLRLHWPPRDHSTQRHSNF
ncbi:FK506 binding protein 1A, 12kDa, transcript variant X1 [Columba livia]|uniref:FK506 binding protein 1A, 12kDa, transcript variant X1 n=1 Tax=Columba livia TaxID=8932 RepID=A0A2I0M5V8_COLLI|nr:FK506 binding protein 1A, 12kDa, transcript variant X1 [Columba livia]